MCNGCFHFSCGPIYVLKKLTLHQRSKMRDFPLFFKRTLLHYLPHVAQTIRIYHECDGRIEKSAPRIAVWHQEACRVMTNGDSEGWISLSCPHTNNEFFSNSPLCLFTYLFIYVFIYFKISFQKSLNTLKGNLT